MSAAVAGQSIAGAVMSADGAMEDGAGAHAEHDTNESHLHETVHLLDSNSLHDDECVPAAGCCPPDAWGGG